LFSLVCSVQFSLAQTISLVGNVKNAQDDPLHFAFVQDNLKRSTYTDSLGNFNLNTNAHTILRINCSGYRDTSIALNGRTNLQVVLISTNSGALTGVAGDASNQAMRNTFRDELTPTSGSQFSVGGGSILPSFNPKEETEGSKYFIKGWAHGYVVTMKDSTIQDPGFFYDYDKMGGGLLLSKDKRSAIEVNRDIVKSFTLYDNSNVAYTFANVSQINPTHYVEVLVSGDKYKIYKTIKTTFEKENFSSDGVMSQGHNYDLYTDESTYYVYEVKTNTLQPIALKKKSLKEAFAKDADKLNKYMSDNSGTIDDFYLTNLGEFMNE